jgi:hypothetical protein
MIFGFFLWSIALSSIAFGMKKIGLSFWKRTSIYSST